jgi:hypothetical protein
VAQAAVASSPTRTVPRERERHPPSGDSTSDFNLGHEIAQLEILAPRISEPPPQLGSLAASVRAAPHPMTASSLKSPTSTQLAHRHSALGDVPQWPDGRCTGRTRQMRPWPFGSREQPRRDTARAALSSTAPTVGSAGRCRDRVEEPSYFAAAAQHDHMPIESCELAEENRALFAAK